MGGSIGLITYLNYMSNWTAASDNDIQSMITEQELYADIGSFDHRSK